MDDATDLCKIENFILLKLSCCKSSDWHFCRHNWERKTIELKHLIFSRVYLDLIYFKCNICVKATKNLQRSFKIISHPHFRLSIVAEYLVTSITHLKRNQKTTHFIKLTNHRGDSGMKNRPGIRTRQGNTPVVDDKMKSLIPHFVCATYKILILGA